MSEKRLEIGSLGVLIYDNRSERARARQDQHPGAHGAVQRGVDYIGEGDVEVGAAVGRQVDGGWLHVYEVEGLRDHAPRNRDIGARR